MQSVFKRTLIRLIIPLLLLTTHTRSGVIDWWGDIYGHSTGNTTLAFLTLPASAAQLARGTVSSSGAMDATDLAQFTANSALTERNQFAASHMEWMMGLRTEYAGATLPVLDVGTFGFFFRTLTSGKFKYARTIDETVSDPTFLEYTLGASFARSFLQNKLSLGANLSYIESRLDIDIGRTVGAGVDARYEFLPGLSGRSYILNAGFPIRYAGSDVSNPLPVQYGLIVNYTPIQKGEFWGVDLGAGLQKTADEPLLMAFSTEVSTGPWLFWRFGYEHMAGQSPDLEGLSAGMGFHVGNYGMDASYKFASEYFGAVWAATIRMQMEELTRKSADDYFAIAEQHFRKKRFHKSEKFALKALKLDPNHWKAQTILSRARSEILRSKHREIALIYTGNLQGQVVPYPPSADALGGLSRQAALVSSLKEAYPVNISIDVGNMVTSSSHPLRARLAVEYYDHMNYDAVAPGRGEIDFGLNRLMKRIDKRLPLVLSDNENIKGLDIVKEAVIKEQGYQFFTINTVVRNETGNDLQKILTGGSAKRSHLRIAVVHGSWGEVKNFARTFTDIDIIIAGSLDQRFESPMKAGSTLILSAGSRGKFVGCLSIRFDEQKRMLSASNKLYPVTQQIAADTVIDNRVNLVNASIELEKAGITLDTQTIKGVFPFVSDRNGTPQVFLKAMETMAEFPLNSGSSNCRKPVFSPVTSRAVCINSSPKLDKSILELIELSTFRKKTLVKDRNITEAHFSPDGKDIYFVAKDSAAMNSGIFRTQMHMDDVITVTPSDNADIKQLTFSPDGSSLLFCSNESGRWNIYALDSSQTAQPVSFTEGNADNLYPRFSPDGRKIAYLSDSTGFGKKMDLWIFDRTTSERKQITHNTNVVDFCWGDDSRTIIFSSGINVFDLNTVDLRENRFEKLTQTRGIKEWSDRNPRFMKYEGRRKIIFNREFPDGSKQLYWCDLDSGNVQMIVKSSGNNWIE